LSGRDLPAAGALSGHANIRARAREYQDSGAFPDTTLSVLEALAFTDLLSGVTAEQRIAFARSADGDPPSTRGYDDEPDDGPNGYRPRHTASALLRAAARPGRSPAPGAKATVRSG
jgi:hypothetical protein